MHNFKVFFKKLFFKEGDFKLSSYEFAFFPWTYFSKNNFTIQILTNRELIGMLKFAVENSMRG